MTDGRSADMHQSFFSEWPGYSTQTPVDFATRFYALDLSCVKIMEIKVR
jgi:hypothetical protein